MRVVAPTDFRELARRRLPRFLFEYIDGGSYAETTLNNNRRDLAEIQLRQRVLCDVDRIDTATELFGTSYALPVGMGPVGIAGLNARRGETQAVRAAAACNVPFALSTVSACSVDEVAAAAPQPFWFQLYIVRDRGFMRDLLHKAREHACSALLFTVDLPVPGTRYRDYRSGLSGAPGFSGKLQRVGQVLKRPGWLWDVGINGRPITLGNLAPVLGGNTGVEDLMGWIGANFDASVTWRDLDFVREQWDGPLAIKGILDLEDARQARDLGADGIVVSNHGGRQLDGAASTARALPAIADAVGGDLTVLADGGVRTGLDVLRMLALGADGVLLGRAWAYALGAAGQAGVEHLFRMLEDEIRVAMALTGVTRIADIDRSLLQD